MSIHIYNNQVPKRQFGFDLIRATAIGFVLLSHLAKAIDYLGFWGVEIFFALSGYLIGTILWRSFSATDSWSTAHLINFWSRRWWRTLPSYYLFLGISILLAWLFGEPLPSATILSKFVWFGQSFTKHYVWLYPVSWSLCVEEWFYLLFPTLLSLLASFRLKASTIFPLAVVVIFISSILIRYLFNARYMALNGSVGTDLRLLTVARLDAIAAGVLVSYYAATVKYSAGQQTALFALGMSLIAGSIAIPYMLDMSFDRIRNNTYLLLSAPMGSALLLPLLGTMPKPGGKLTFIAKSVEKISLWSYSIYLSHMPILVTIYALQDKFLGAGLRDDPFKNLLTKALGFVLILAASAFLYNHFEQPLTRRRPAELRQSSRPVELPALHR